MPKRLLQNTFDAIKDNRTYSDEGKSKGELDDYPVRRYLATKEGTITKVPVNNFDIANKKYVDDQDHSSVSLSDSSTIDFTLVGQNITASTIGATGSFTAGSGETVTVVNGLVTSISIAFLILLETGDFVLMENSDRVANG